MKKFTFKIPKKYYLYLFFIAVCAVVHIVFALETVAYGSQLSALEAESENLKKANKSLELEYVSASSLLKLKENSENLGFVKPGTTLYISFEESVASLRN